MNTNMLVLYNSTQTYTNTVFEHIDSLRKYSKNNVFFCHQDQTSILKIEPDNFDVIAIHYSVRLPFDQISETTAEMLSQYTGLKVLFIQDEYDHTHRAWHWIKKLGIHLVFSVVPPESLSKIYPPEEFPGVHFVNILTGYVPEELLTADVFLPPSARKLMVGYRGRPLHLRYGQLGREKISIGKQVKEYCQANEIAHDIEYTEDARIYGENWYKFISNCRSMLGSESGSNVFDWDGSLADRVEEFRKENKADDDLIYKSIIEPRETPDVMNQVSPRIFESIAFRTALVLYEGNYSNVVIPNRHFIPLKKNGENLAEVFSKLNDDQLVDEMTTRAYEEIIASGNYSYRAFIKKIDDEIDLSLKNIQRAPVKPAFATDNNLDSHPPTPITTSPVRCLPPPSLHSPERRMRLLAAAYLVWGKLPEGLRTRLLPGIKVLLGRK